MSFNIATCRFLAERAVDAIVEAELIFNSEFDSGFIQHATTALREPLSAQQIKASDLEYVLHTLMFDLAQQLPPDIVPHLNYTDTAGSATMRRIAGLIDIATELSDNGTADASLAFALLEEAMDMVSVAVACELFGHIERRASVLRRNMTATGGKGIIMLKMCNTLLRRIPYSTMSEFAGRVQLFVANSFTLSERSGVNLRGDICNTVVATPSNQEDASDGENVELYRAFWSLQEYFANPQKAFPAPVKGEDEGEKINGFIAAATLTINEFRKTATSKSAPIHLDPTGSEPMRYLTSPSLLQLQFGDAQFKCQILLQLLIFVKYALAMSGDRITELRTTATNKLVIGGLEISEADQASLRDLRRRAGSQLVSAANDRGLFSRTSQFVLFHENNWAKWKADSCRPFEGAAVPELFDEMQAAARAYLAVRDAQFPRPSLPMGTAGLAELWPTPTEPVDGLGSDLQRLDLVAAMRNLDIYCRGDGDYDLLTQSEQTRADVLQWRALRSAVMDDMFRRVDPASKSLAQLRDEILPSMVMDVES
ncbi:hypothetical protein GGI21_000128 [Coemansia aciculifera]|uniref:Uncharacterized protein n=1 Tax=Coemansia aciculifera TaxID=417176 RepID=A0ACC1M8D8_9FUNG|nr:hypothetical protein IWW38_000968 [Coemansia aciculifera]KAJ2911214.1 hypothetical protein GGI21_000128 [Coemansia aciculifera]